MAVFVSIIIFQPYSQIGTRAGGWSVAAAEQDQFVEFGSIITAGELNYPRYNHTATLMTDGDVLIMGGTTDGRSALVAAEVFDAATQAWTVTGQMATPRQRHAATRLASGEILVSGGYTGNGYGSPTLFKHYNGPGNHSLASCELYNPAIGTFVPAAPLDHGRFWHRAVLLNDGRVLVIGGLNVSIGALATCEIYDRETNNWSPAASLSEPKARFTTTVLPDGSVLVTGGHDGRTKTPVNTCERYDPVTNTWTSVAAMHHARGYHAAALMANGCVLVSGGFAGPQLEDWADGEIYDPLNDTWVMTTNLSLPRHAHDSVRLPGGEILILCGSSCLTGYCHSGFEYYDPVTGEWKETNLVALGRKWSRATALADGEVLITGGQTCLNATAVSDIYRPPITSEPAGTAGGTATDVDPSDLLLGLVMLAVAPVAIFGILIGMVVKRVWFGDCARNRSGRKRR